MVASDVIFLAIRESATQDKIIHLDYTVERDLELLALGDHGRRVGYVDTPDYIDSWSINWERDEEWRVILDKRKPV